MAGVCLLALAAGLLLKVCGLAAEITEENTGKQQGGMYGLRRQEASKGQRRKKYWRRAGGPVVDHQACNLTLS